MSAKVHQPQPCSECQHHALRNSLSWHRAGNLLHAQGSGSCILLPVYNPTACSCCWLLQQQKPNSVSAPSQNWSRTEDYKKITNVQSEVMLVPCTCLNLSWAGTVNQIWKENGSSYNHGINKLKCSLEKWEKKSERNIIIGQWREKKTVDLKKNKQKVEKGKLFLFSSSTLLKNSIQKMKKKERKGCGEEEEERVKLR